MENFLFGLFSCVTLFAISFLLAVIINKFIPLKKKKQQKKSEDVYYIAGVGEMPKRKQKNGVAIRGELLGKSAFKKILKDKNQ